MTTRSAKSATADEVAAIENLVSDLERRLQRLSNLSRSARGEVSGAGGDVKDFVSEALSGIMERIREGTVNAGQSALDEVAHASGDAVKKLGEEVEQRPLMMLAIAAGIGFLVGYANRR
jgi:ElaB/YqjD/DUF883 family membrane-anchored ribosome-binding protein